VHRTVAEVGAPDYGGLVLPGGVLNPDALRTDQGAVQLVRQFFAARKPVAAICHGPWLLVEADVVRHRTLTSWPSLRTDIANAGGNWVNKAVHADAELVTSRRPDDLRAFCARLLEVFAASSNNAPPERTPMDDLHDIRPGDEAAAVDVASADSFPASDPPSSLRTT
jgi:protease I